MPPLVYIEPVEAQQNLAPGAGYPFGRHQVVPLPTEGTVVGGAERFARADVQSERTSDVPDQLIRQAGLTSRDVDVLRFLAQGWTTADIAHELAYAESTIKKEVHFIVHRLGARNRTHAVALAIRGDVI